MRSAVESVCITVQNFPYCNFACRKTLHKRNLFSQVFSYIFALQRFFLYWKDIAKFVSIFFFDLTNCTRESILLKERLRCRTWYVTCTYMWITILYDIKSKSVSFMRFWCRMLRCISYFYHCIVLFDIILELYRNMRNRFYLHINLRLYFCRYDKRSTHKEILKTNRFVYLKIHIFKISSKIYIITIEL